MGWYDSCITGIVLKRCFINTLPILKQPVDQSIALLIGTGLDRNQNFSELREVISIGLNGCNSKSTYIIIFSHNTTLWTWMPTCSVSRNIDEMCDGVVK